LSQDARPKQCCVAARQAVFCQVLCCVVVCQVLCRCQARPRRRWPVCWQAAAGPPRPTPGPSSVVKVSPAHHGPSSVVKASPAHHGLQRQPRGPSHHLQHRPLVHDRTAAAPREPRSRRPRRARTRPGAASARRLAHGPVLTASQPPFLLLALLALLMLLMLPRGVGRGVERLRLHRPARGACIARGQAVPAAVKDVRALARAAGAGGAQRGGRGRVRMAVRRAVEGGRLAGGRAHTWGLRLRVRRSAARGTCAPTFLHLPSPRHAPPLTTAPGPATPMRTAPEQPRPANAPTCNTLVPSCSFSGAMLRKRVAHEGQRRRSEPGAGRGDAHVRSLERPLSGPTTFACPFRSLAPLRATPLPWLKKLPSKASHALRSTSPLPHRWRWRRAWRSAGRP
jgi:hypothetical protein